MRKLWLLLILLAIPVLAYAQATSSVSWISGQPVKVITVPWVADGFSVVPNAKIDNIDGEVLGFKIVPSATAAPEANYDTYIYDYVSGAHLNGTTTINRSATATEFVHLNGAAADLHPFYHYGTVGFSVSALGVDDEGTFIIYVKVPK